MRGSPNCLSFFLQQQIDVIYNLQIYYLLFIYDLTYLQFIKSAKPYNRKTA